jgi:hypothetical protein
MSRDLLAAGMRERESGVTPPTLRRRREGDQARKEGDCPKNDEILPNRFLTRLIHLACHLRFQAASVKRGESQIALVTTEIRRKVGQSKSTTYQQGHKIVYHAAWSFTDTAPSGCWE